MRYSVLTYNINGYEIIHNIPNECMNPEIEYIYVTDDHSITSDTWTVVYADDLTGSTFDKCYQIRFNPFKYVHTDTVMRIDGSMGIVNDVMPIFQLFDKGQYEASVMIHPTRQNMYDEYVAWCQQRFYPVEQANKCLNFMISNGYDIKGYKGLYQFNFMIQRKGNFNDEWNKTTYDVLKNLATPPETIERVDQTIGSFILNRFYSDRKIMPVGQYICNGMFFNWYQHNTENIMSYNPMNDCDAFLFNKLTYFAPLWL